MAINLSALALGQILLTIGDAGAPAMFTLTAILFCAAVMPVMTTRLIPPEVPHVSRLRLVTLYALAPVATIGAGLSGLAMGAFWGLLPVYANRIGLDSGGVAMFMLTAIVGGAVLQWPIGRISDGHDRRIGLATVSVLAAGIAIAAALPMVQTQTTVLFVLFFCLWRVGVFAVSVCGGAHARLPAARKTCFLAAAVCCWYTASARRSARRWLAVRCRNSARPPYRCTSR